MSDVNGLTATDRATDRAIAWASLRAVELAPNPLIPGVLQKQFT